MPLTDNQENKLNMIEDVDALLDTNPTKVALVAMLGSKHLELKIKKTDIKTKAQEKDTVTAGKAQDKYDAENVLIKGVMSIAGPLIAFGSDNGLNDVVELAHVTPSRLRLMRDTTLAITCQKILDTANANAPALIPYGVTAIMLTALQTAIDNFNTAMATREAARDTKSGIGLTIKDQFRDCLLHLESMDNVVEALRQTEKEFYAKYHFSRVIRDLGNVNHVRRGNLAPNQTFNVLAGGFNDATIFVLKNRGTTDLRYCTINDAGTACTGGILLHAGEQQIKTGLELGLPGAGFLNVTNVDGTNNGSYEVEF